MVISCIRFHGNIFWVGYDQVCPDGPGKEHIVNGRNSFSPRENMGTEARLDRFKEFLFQFDYSPQKIQGHLLRFGMTGP